MIAHSQTRAPIELTFGELREQVARARAGLERLGVGAGDRVVAYLPNIPETLVAFLATASLGAIWATCAPEFGPRSVIAAVRDRRAQGAADRRRLPLRRAHDRPPRRRRRRSARRCRRSSTSCTCPTPAARDDAIPDAIGWDDLLARAGPLRVRPLSRSTIRSTSSSPRGRPGCRRRSSTATAGSRSSTSRTTG